ncbi:MAG: hypothetical protein ABSE08_12950 [Syntrophobacteraceae bacterium]|jgi:hypothetical protein
MMKYFYIQPEVAGGLGENTVMDRSVHPPIVSKLHYAFDGWGGDVLLRSFPCLIVTEDAKKKLQSVGLTGMRFDKVEVTTSEFFQDRYPNLQLPKFVWLQVAGKPGQDDFGFVQDARLLVSERALKVLEGLGISNALVTPFDEGQ